MKKKIRLTESQLHKVIKESVKKLLKESVTEQDFETELQQNFFETVNGLYQEVVKDFAEGRPYLDWLMEDAEDMAYTTATELTEDSIELLKSDDWDYPKYNFRPLEFVMEKEYGISNFQELLKAENPVEIYTDWFWDAFGTYATKYNFETYVSEKMSELDEEYGIEDEDE